MALVPFVLLTLYVREWSLLGPFPVEGPDDEALSEQISSEGAIEPGAFEPPEGYRWERVTSPTDHLDLIVQYDGHQTGPHVAYSHTYVNTPEGMTANLLVSHTNGGAVWVNGAPVRSDMDANAERYDDVSVPVELRRGWNRILVKHFTTGENPSNGFTDPWAWWSSLRFVDGDGFAVVLANRSDLPSDMAETVPPPGVWHRTGADGPSPPAAAQTPYELFFAEQDVPALRAKIGSGRLRRCAETLGLLTDHYLETVHPDIWVFDENKVDEVSALRIEKVLVRLAFQYVLTEDARYAELSRRVAMRTCALTWPDEPRAIAAMRRGLACALDWTADTLLKGEIDTILARLPDGFEDTILSPAAALDVDLRSQEWLAWSGSRFGGDFKFGAVICPPSSWYALKAQTDPAMQWLADRLFRDFPSKSDAADEVWTIIHYDTSIEAAQPASYDAELDATAVAARDARLAQMLKDFRDTPWIPFDRDAPKPLRPELLGKHPRLMVTPDRLDEIVYRAAAVPETLWRPRFFLTEEKFPPIVVSGTRGFTGHQLVSVAACYLATGQDRYLEEAVKIMQLLCDHPHWFNPGDPSDVDMAGSAALYGVAVAYDALHDHLTPDQRQRIRDKLAIQAARTYRHWSSDTWHKYTVPHSGNEPWDNNHCYVALGALWCAAAAIFEDVPEAVETLYPYAADSLSKVMYITNAADGFAQEGRGYAAYARTGNLIPYLDMFRNATGVDTFDYYRYVEKQVDYLLHTLMPGGKYALNMGDCAGAEPFYQFEPRYWEMRAILLKAASEYQDELAQGLAAYTEQVADFPAPNDAMGPTWHDPASGDAYRLLLWWDPTVAAKDPRTELPPYHHFDDHDAVVMRSSWSDDATHFALRCGPPEGHRTTTNFLNGDMPGWDTLWPNHLHADLNSFFIYDHGAYLAADTGYVHYGEWPSTREHNTIAVDGGGQIHPGDLCAPWDHYGVIGDFFAAPKAGYYLRGEAADGYEVGLLERFDRNVMMIPDPDDEETYFVIHDRLESKNEHTYEWLLHSPSPASAEGDQVFTVEKEGRTLAAKLLRPDKLVAYNTGEYNGVRKLALAPEAKSRDVDFLAALTLYPTGSAGPTVDLVDDGHAIQVGGSTWNDAIAIDGTGAGIESDGSYAFVRRSDGAVVRWSVIGATSLTHRSQPLLRTPATCSAAGAISDGALHVVVEADAVAPVELYCATEPQRCIMDGKEIDVGYDCAATLVTLSVPAGRHEVTLD